MKSKLSSIRKGITTMDKEAVEVDMNALMIQALQELNLKVESLRARVEQMEKCPWDEWKANRDIV